MDRYVIAQSADANAFQGTSGMYTITFLRKEAAGNKGRNTFGGAGNKLLLAMGEGFADLLWSLSPFFGALMYEGREQWASMGADLEIVVTSEN